MTLLSVDDALPVTVSFPSSSESEDKLPSANVSGTLSKVKNQILVDSQSKPLLMNGLCLRTNPPAIHGRNLSSVNRPNSLRGMPKRTSDPSLKVTKPKAQFTLQVLSDSYRRVLT